MVVYGPYLRKDNRKHVILVREDGRRQTVSYPKYLLQNHIGRDLVGDETVDHIDDDFTNDDISNLQILTRAENSKKYKDANPALILELTCKYCGILFDRVASAERANREVKKMDGPFCSKSCMGKVHHRVSK